MKTLLALAAALPLLAVDGVVMNQTTGKPQPNVILQLIQPGQGGMQTLGTAKSDAEGKFKIDKSTGDGPALVQAIFGGVTYTKMLPPGSAPSGVEIPVYDATKAPGTAKLAQRAVILQPGDSGLQVNEMYLVQNSTQTTFNDPSSGAIRFYAPKGHGEIGVTVNAPGGMPVQRQAQAAGAPDTLKVDFPVKPGETRFDLSYTLPSKEYAGKTLMEGGETRIVVPAGVDVQGDGLEPLGTEPQTQARIFSMKAKAFTLKVSGSGAMGGAGSAENGGGAAAQEEDPGRPEIKQSMPRIYDKLYVVLGLSLAILAAGFALLYRSRKA